MSKGKKVLLFGVAGISVTLLLVFYLGGKGAKSEESSHENIEEVIEEKEEFVEDPKNEREGERVDEGFGHVIPDEENEEDAVAVEIPIDETPQMSDFFDPKDVEVTKEIALDFVTKFHNYDRDNPLRHIMLVEEYLYKDLYTFYLENEVEKIEGAYNIQGIKKRDVVSTNIVETDTPYPFDIYWNVEVVSDVLNNDGTKEKETLIYNLFFEKNVLGDYKIGDFFLQ